MDFGFTGFTIYVAFYVLTWVSVKILGTLTFKLVKHVIAYAVVLCLFVVYKKFKYAKKKHLHLIR